MLAILGLPPVEDIYEGRDRIQRVLHENNMTDQLDDILKLAINDVSSNGSYNLHVSPRSDEAFRVPLGKVIKFGSHSR